MVGRKKWHLCAPTENDFLYKAGDIDTFNPDYYRFPRFKKAKCIQTIMNPGDVLYYPTNYWHQTINLDTPSISLTGTMVGDQNYEAVAKEIKAECSGRGTIFTPNLEMCSMLDKCFELWSDIFNFN